MRARKFTRLGRRFGLPQIGLILISMFILAAQAGASPNNPPSAPGNLTVNPTSGTEAELSWSEATDDTGVDHYGIYRDCMQVGTTAGTTYTDTGLSAAETYFYYVLAYDDESNESGGGGACVTTLEPDVTPPSVPSGLTASLTGKSVVLNWAASADDRLMGGYKVYRDDVQIGTVSAAEGTTFKDTAVDSSTMYTYQVAAYDDSGNESAKSSEVAVTTPNYLLFSDFESGASDWTVTSGSWSVTFDGSKVYKSSTTFDNSVAIGDAAWTDYTVETRVKVKSWTTTNAPHSGIRVRYVDNNNYYFLGFNRGGLSIYRVLNGVTVGKVNTAFAIQTGQWYTFKAVVQGTTLELYVDGNLELTTTDSSLTAGQAGLDSRFGDSRFDDFAVTQ